MKKWLLQLEVTEGDDEFFQSLDLGTQHTVLKNFILDVLHANSLEAKVRLNRYEEDYDEETAFEAYKPPASSPVTSD